tara:strand:+ start:2997 stop:4820 length:1824 start_codon:yes stop_codon:yes gene_type:complete
MVYSNEVYLVNSNYARIVHNATSFKDIDVESTALNYSARVGVDIVEGISTRIFKLIDVSNDYNHDMPCLLLERSDGLLIICRILDVLFTDKRLLTVTWSKSRDMYLIHMPKSVNDVEFYPQGDTYDVCTSLEMYATDESKCLLVWDTYRNAEFVDKTDSRHGPHRNRFFLSTDTYGHMTTYMDKCDIERSRGGYEQCSNCGDIVLKRTIKDVAMASGVVERICKTCYDTLEIPCDCCHVDMPISDRIGITRDRALQRNSTDVIFANNDITSICNTCYEGTLRTCSRCRCYEIIDIDNLRASDNRNETIRQFNIESTYRYIFSRQYCSDCADILLTTYLANPFNYSPLPRSYSAKSAFDTFVGIESEVITESEGASEYIDEDREVPRYFRVVDDGSLNQGGVEFVTRKPIIGTDVDRALDELEEAHQIEWNTVDSSCGLHIHMNALDMGFKEIKSLLMIMSRIQNVIYDSIPNNRRDTSYARVITMTPKEIAKIDTLGHLITSYYGMVDSVISDNKYNEARYIGTNIHARFYLGSIEFRYHEGTIRANHIKEWIMFLNKIMSSSKSLYSNPKLYRKIIDTKFSALDIVRDITGISGVEYIESKIDNNS